LWKFCDLAHNPKVGGSNPSPATNPYSPDTNASISSTETNGPTR
jgi:hypothetical protein